MKGVIFIIIVCFLSSSFSLESSAKKRKKKGEIAQTGKPKTEKLSSFDQFFKDREKDGYMVKGMIDQFVSGRDLFFVLPLELLNKRMLLGSTLEEVSDNGEAMVGEKPFTPLLLFFTKDSATIQVREDCSMSFAEGQDANIQKALDENNIGTVLLQLPILAYNKDSTAVLFNGKDLFMNDEIPGLSAVSPYATNSYFGNIVRAGRLMTEHCYFKNARGYEDNISASVTLSYQVDAFFWGMFQIYKDKPYTAVMNRTLMLLPGEPMRPRIADERVGVFPTGKYRYSSKENGVKVNWFANRWRLEPSDPDAFKRGELTEPKKPILIYIDNNFPEEWVEYIRLGLLDWNPAFEKIGYKNAVQCKMFPKDDPHFDPNNLKYSCIRYVPTIEENSMGPSWVDPRTGEILNASVYVYHNIVSLLNRWRFIQTAAVDEEVRDMKLSDELLGDAIRYVVAHELGHCLGLMHNMGASASIPTDSLRSPGFTRKYGTTPSIMDYARFNYVAQPGDKERGVILTPPHLGVYDEYVIRWMYAGIPDAKTPKDEIPTLNKWIEEKSGDPMYRYGKQQIYVYDPSSQSECLGDDAVKASGYGINNLKYIYKNIPKWIQGDQDNQYKAQLVYTLTSQYVGYLSHVINELGGIYLTEHKEGDQFVRVATVPRGKQRQALAFLMDQLADGQWINDCEIDGLPLTSDLDRMVCTYIYRGLWNRKRNVGLAAEKSRGVDTYATTEFVTDVYRAIFKRTREKKNLKEKDCYLQEMLISSLLQESGYKLPGSNSSLFGFTDKKTPDNLVGLLDNDYKLYQKCGLHSDVYYLLQDHARQCAENGEYIVPGQVSGFFFQPWVNFKDLDMSGTYFGLLEDIKSSMRQAIPSSDASTRAHYQCMLRFIDKVSNP